MKKLVALVKLQDEQLFNHLRNYKISYMTFAFNWLQNLLIREFQKLTFILQIWDRLFGFIGRTQFSVSKFQLSLMVNILRFYSEKIRNLTSTQDIYQFLCNIPLSELSFKELEVILTNTCDMVNNNSIINDLFDESKIQNNCKSKS